MDPLAPDYPWYTPYQFAGNKPIMFVDVDGLEEGVDIRNRMMEMGYLRGKVTERELKEYYTGQALGAAMGVGILLSRGAVLRYGHKIIPFIYANPNAPMVGTALIWGALLDEEFPIQSPFDDVSRMSRKGGKVVLDFFGGAFSSTKGAINVDPVAKTGFPLKVNELLDLAKQKNLLGSVDEIVANNPQDTFLNEASELLKEGGEITIRGTMSNKYFNKIFSGTEEGLENFDIVSKVEGAVNEGYKRSDGKSIVGQINEIVLKRKQNE